MERNRGFHVSSLAVILVAMAALPALAQEPLDAAVPAVASADDFKNLHWLEGTWRGEMPTGGFFFERYTLINDSTFAVEAFPDSSLNAPQPIGRVSLRGGVLYREEPTGERVSATRLDESGVLFGTRERGFTWAPGPAGSWTATIHRKVGQSETREVVYRMKPYEGAGVQERLAVAAAVLDYVEALYAVDPRRIERSVHPELAKRGFWRRESESAYQELTMTYDELHSLAARWNQGGRVDPSTALKEIVVLDVLDQTASAKLTAEWGTDYLHLAKYNDRWKIVNVLWQSPEPTSR